MRPAATAFCGELPTWDDAVDGEVTGNAGQRMSSSSLFSIQVWMYPLIQLLIQSIL